MKKTQENLREFVRYAMKVIHANGTVIYKFLAFLKLEKILHNFCFSEQIFNRKQFLGAPYLLSFGAQQLHVNLGLIAKC